MSKKEGDNKAALDDIVSANRLLWQQHNNFHAAVEASSASSHAPSAAAVPKPRILPVSLGGGVVQAPAPVMRGALPAAFKPYNPYYQQPPPPIPPARPPQPVTAVQDMSAQGVMSRMFDSTPFLQDFLPPVADSSSSVPEAATAVEEDEVVYVPSSSSSNHNNSLFSFGSGGGGGWGGGGGGGGGSEGAEEDLYGSSLPRAFNQQYTIVNAGGAYRILPMYARTVASITLLSHQEIAVRVEQGKVGAEVINDLQIVPGARFDRSLKRFVFPLAAHQALVSLLSNKHGLDVEAIPFQALTAATLYGKQADEQQEVQQGPKGEADPNDTSVASLPHRLSKKLLLALAPFQQQAVSFVMNKDRSGRALIADEMGLGESFLSPPSPSPSPLVAFALSVYLALILTPLIIFPALPTINSKTNNPKKTNKQTNKRQDTNSHRVRHGLSSGLARAHRVPQQRKAPLAAGAHDAGLSRASQGERGDVGGEQTPPHR